MAVLSDRDIKKKLLSKSLVINNLKEENISMSSIDLRLSNAFRVFKYSGVKYIDPMKGVKSNLMDYVEKSDGESMVIHPGELVLGSTIEEIQMPSNLVGRLDGRSSLARLGIVIHSTAGSIDPGFRGQITLEIANLSKVPVCLYPNMRVCRITFDELSSEPDVTYATRKGSKYNDQKGPEFSRIKKD